LSRGEGSAGEPPSRRRALASQIPPSVAEKKSQDGISFAVTDFLAGLRLSGSERVLGALAIALAEGMDSSPPYVKARLAKELREVLALLAQAELSPENLALLEGIEL
jgi:hypothetical protein